MLLVPVYPCLGCFHPLVMMGMWDGEQGEVMQLSIDATCNYSSRVETYDTIRLSSLPLFFH